MLLSERHIRSIIRTELSRKSPSKVEDLVSEGIFDFLGGIFAKIVDAMSGAFKMYTDLSIKRLEAAKDQAIKNASANANVPVPQGTDSNDLDPNKDDEKFAFAVSCISPHAQSFIAIRDFLNKVEKSPKIIPGEGAKPEESQPLKDLTGAVSLAIVIAKDYAKFDSSFSALISDEPLPPDKASQRIAEIFSAIAEKGVMEKLLGMMPEEVKSGFDEPVKQYFSALNEAKASNAKVQSKLREEASKDKSVKESRYVRDYIRAKIIVHDIMWS